MQWAEQGRRAMTAKLSGWHYCLHHNRLSGHLGGDNTVQMAAFIPYQTATLPVDAQHV